MNAKGIIDLPKMLEWFSTTPAGLKIADESNKHESLQRKAIAERLAEVRREEAAIIPSLWDADAAALARVLEARENVKVAEREHALAVQAHWAKSSEFTRQAGL